jgi:hypothetical protein
VAQGEEKAQAELLRKHGAELLARMNATPDRVGFPKSNLR